MSPVNALATVTRLAIAVVLVVTVTTAVAEAREFPDTTNGIFVFDDQLDTSSMTDAQFQFAATHFVGTQKVVVTAARRLRQANPNFLVLHYRLGQALGQAVGGRQCRPGGEPIQIIDGDRWVPEWPGDATVRENWFFHWNGQRVFNCTWGHYLMNLDDPDWRSWWTSQVIQQLQAEEADGQFAGRWKWIPNIGAYVTTRDPSDYSNLDGAMIEGFGFWNSGNYLATGDWILQMNRILQLVMFDRILIAQSYPEGAEERMFALHARSGRRKPNRSLNRLSTGWCVSARCTHWWRACGSRWHTERVVGVCGGGQRSSSSTFSGDIDESDHAKIGRPHSRVRPPGRLTLLSHSWPGCAACRDPDPE